MEIEAGTDVTSEAPARTVGESPKTRRLRRVPPGLRMIPFVVLGALACGMGVTAGLGRHSAAPRWPCKDVGLSGPPAPTARAALATVVASDPTQPPASIWRVSASERLKAGWRTIEFTNPRYVLRGDTGYWKVIVSQGSYEPAPKGRAGTGKWQPVGACV